MNIDFEDYGNAQVANLPQHLKQFVVKQDYASYTNIDHAVWRYVMRKNVAFLKEVAHESYLNGLEKTGITIEQIPNIKEMNRILGDIGWGCVCVDGFLPPSAFMEFQAFKVLVIAADIRQLEHIEYTPAPDILHEAAGHAPIIADPGYAEYLRLFGEIGSKAISSSKDFELYEAIRHLSIIKEDPNTSDIEILKAEEDINNIQKNMGPPSEMSLIRNLHWWTVEYGLIGDIDKPKIYGAGLLSSIGESESCMKPDVQKLPYSLDAVNMSFDITEPQPQLFVTPSYQYLVKVLDKFAESMALRTGGLEGLEKAIESKGVCTAQFSSGLQVSGVFNKVWVDNGVPIYLSTSSPTALAWHDKELVGHSKDYHADGFSSPIGKLKGEDKPLELLSIDELSKHSITLNNKVELCFDSGVVVLGYLENIRKNRNGKNMIFSFKDCKVIFNNEVLFQPEWGVYDMAVGQVIDSVFAGPADLATFDRDNSFVPKEKTHKIVYSDERKQLDELYGMVRQLRQKPTSNISLRDLFSSLKNDFENDWLCCLELLEITKDVELASEINAYLSKMCERDKTHQDLIKDGIDLL